jgi:hypothetical protein
VNDPSPRVTLNNGFEMPALVDLFDFALTGDEVAEIDGLDTGVRAEADPELASARTLHVKVPSA